MPLAMANLTQVAPADGGKLIIHNDKCILSTTFHYTTMKVAAIVNGENQAVYIRDQCLLANFCYISCCQRRRQ